MIFDLNSAKDWSKKEDKRQLAPSVVLPLHRSDMILAETTP